MDLPSSEDTTKTFSRWYDFLPIIVYVCDSVGNLTYANHQWYSYTGGEDIRLCDWGSYIHPDDKEHTLRQWTLALQEKNTLIDDTSEIREQIRQFIANKERRRW